MADVEISYKGNVITSLNATGNKILQTEGFYCEDDIEIAYTQPSGGTGNFELIGTKVFSNVEEYTDTATTDTMYTGIDIKNTDYAWGYVVITCDSAIGTSTEWGMTLASFGRYTSNGNVFVGNVLQQKGSSTLSKAAMVNGTISQSNYGVWISSNTATIDINRKCNGTGCPKIRAGNYTVKVYGMTGF